MDGGRRDDVVATWDAFLEVATEMDDAGIYGSRVPRPAKRDEPRRSVLAERELVGGLLGNPWLIPLVLDTVAPGDFTDGRCATVLEVIRDLPVHDGALLATELEAALRARGKIDHVGGLRFIEELLGGTTYLPGAPSAARLIEAAAQRVAECAKARRFEELGRRLQIDARDWTIPVHDLAALTAEGAHLAADHAAPVVPLGHDVDGFLAELEDQRAGALATPGLSTGFPSIDAATAGMRPGQLWILAARPRCGKTSLALALAVNVAAGGRVLFFSQEMSRRELLRRAASMLTAVPLSAMLAPRGLTDADMAALRHVGPPLRDLPLLVRDASAVTVSELAAVARAHHARAPLSLVVVDYLQLVKPDHTHGDNRAREVSDVARGLKALAKDLDVPVLALAQVGRAFEARGTDARPRLSDLKESGGIEEAADVVAFIDREELRNPKSERKGSADVIFEKQRDGESGAQVALAFHAPCASFREYDQ